jgi:hypothetical protein
MVVLLASRDANIVDDLGWHGWTDVREKEGLSVSATVIWLAVKDKRIRSAW